MGLLTYDLPIDRSATYTDFVSIQKFASTFKLAGGINLPKIITCVGSDGVNRRQLVKVSIKKVKDREKCKIRSVSRRSRVERSVK